MHIKHAVICYCLHYRKNWLKNGTIELPYDVWSRLVAGNEPVVDVEAEEGRREHQHRDGIQHAGVLQQPRQPAL